MTDLSNTFSRLLPWRRPRFGGPLAASGEEPGERRPGDEPRQPQRGHGGNQGPPDLDELWNDFNRKLGSLFGGAGRGRRPAGGGGGGGGRGFQPSTKGASIGVLVLLLGAFAIWVASGVFIVREGEQAVITTFGRFDGVRGPGLNLRFPYPIQREEIVRVTQIRSVDVGGDDIIRSTGLRESAMLTKDENIIEMKFAVQYRLSNARDYLFETKAPDAAVVQVAKSAVREVAGKMSMDTALAEERDQIAPRVRDIMQSILDHYQAGIQVVAVNMQEGGARPPEQVQDAFDDVLKAGQERERIKNEAQAYANDVVPRAVGTAARLTQEADGYRARIVAQAQGDSDRFLSVLAEYEKAPRVTRDRLYIDAMQQIYSGVNKVLIDSRSGNNLMFLPLDKLMEQAAGQAGTNRGAGPVGSSQEQPAQPVQPARPPASSAVQTDPRSRADARSRAQDFR